VRHDSTAENMKLLWSYLEKFGRPLTFDTDKESLFQTTEKRKRDEPGVEKDPVEMPPTRIGRALQELGIRWMAARSPQAKGRVERNFGTAQDRLVKGMRVAGVTTLEQANEYLRNDYLVWWERELTVEAAHGDDAHRGVEKSHNLAASLSHVETRQVRNDYTLRWEGKLYQIERQAVTTGLRRAQVRIEKRLDGSLAVRYGPRYLPLRPCAVAKELAPSPVKPRGTPPRRRTSRDWGQNFDLKKGPKIWQAAAAAGPRGAVIRNSQPGFGSRRPSKDALYRETLQTTGRTTRILNRPKRVCVHPQSTVPETRAEFRRQCAPSGEPRASSLRF